MERDPNVSTTPITSMGYRQCLPLSVVLLKGKHCRKPLCRKWGCRNARAYHHPHQNGNYSVELFLMVNFLRSGTEQPKMYDVLK